MLYEANYSREIYPYWNFERFNLDTFDDAQCLTEFRFNKRDIYTLAECLQIPAIITCSQRSKCDGLEGLCILLKRLSSPCRYSDMVPIFGRYPTAICLIFNYMLDYIYDNHKHRIQS